MYSVSLNPGGNAVALWRRGHSLIRPIHGCAAGQSRVFGFLAMNSIKNLRQFYPKWVKVARFSLLNMVCPKQGPKIEGVVRHRVGG